MAYLDTCGRPLSRRQLLLRCANGFGAVALTTLLTERAFGSLLEPSPAVNPLAPRPAHHPARVTSVIFLYMDGGPSQVDTWDPKPRLDREDGQLIKMKAPPTQFIAHDTVPKVMRSPWKFRRHGQSGTPVSDLFPHVAGCVDELCVVRSMVANFTEHANANLFLHTGFNQQGRPSMGAWVTYGLGSACHNLPGYIVLKGGQIPAGGPDNFHSGFLPAVYQGSVFRDTVAPVANLQRPEANEELQRSKLELLSQLDQAVLGRLGPDDRLESAIANYELAFRMQAAVPDVLDIRGESAATRRLYGVDEEATRAFGMQCLLARRLVERGVRFVELTPPAVTGANRWDQHDKLKDGHEKLARATDQPVAALLKDLKARGLLEQTLVVWGGEFGRTPVAQGTSTGRDHSPYGFSIWLAGGGIQGGLVYGATDEYGFHAIEHKVEIHDLHATMLHLLGIDHKRLTYRFGGRDMRLTDVHGQVIQSILA
ncbi:MAG: DUF1501 domain-containing protein [Gemmataceae bacterium]|nr:DUF1501 domain-containing protein [Gemmataceae bacterium]